VPKRRFQQGCLRIVGDQWVLYFHRDEVRDGVRGRYKISKRSGHMSLSKRQARKLAQPILDEVNNQTDVPVREMKNGMTLAEYIPEFRRVGMTDLKPSTRRSMESSIRAHLIPVLGETSLSKSASFHCNHSRLMATQKGLSNRLRAGRGRRRFSTANCCRSTKFSKMKSRRLRKIRRSDPNASQSTLSIVRFITRVLASGPLLCY
jgi:hypothetical protein